MDSAKRVISGTWGQLWLDSELVAECYGVQAKSSFTREDIVQCGVMATDSKISAIKNTGSLKLHKVNSRMAINIGDKIRTGQDPRFTLISKLSDPDAYGAERIVLKNVSFDDLTLADWEAGSTGKVECPFIFGDYEFLDRIEVR